MFLWSHKVSDMKTFIMINFKAKDKHSLLYLHQIPVFQIDYYIIINDFLGLWVRKLTFIVWVHTRLLKDLFLVNSVYYCDN